MSEVKDYLTFTKGINTESSPLAFPENSSIDEYNCVLYRDGSRQRRLGLDLEDAAEWDSVSNIDGFRWNVMTWDGAGGISERRFIVVQAGNKLMFYDGTQSSFSSNKVYEYTFPEPSPITIGLKVEGISVLGDFVVTSAGLPIVFRWDPTTNVFESSYIQIMIRDVFGVFEDISVDYNPTTLTKEHEYNLLNQGWSKRAPSTSGSQHSKQYPGKVYGSSQVELDPYYITQYKNSSGVYPDNTQVWWAGKDAEDNFSASALDKIDFGTTAAPKGRVVLDAFNRGDTRKLVFPSGTSLPVDKELGRPTTLAFAFQRTFYAGINGQLEGGDANSPIMTGFVFFSRTLRNHYDLGWCYPAADPCSEYDASLVDTDGGFVNIPDSGKIYSIAAIGEALLVLAQFGVWAIIGGDSGFTASNYSVKKLTGFGVSSPEATVLAEKTVFYWSEGGIYSISMETSGFSVNNITETTIETLLNNIPLESKTNITGIYDTIGKRVQWLLNQSNKSTGFAEGYDNELVLDLQLGAFYRHSYVPNVSTIFISGYALSRDFLALPALHKSRLGCVVKYLVVRTQSDGTYGFTFCYQRDPTFHDFPTIVNDNYVSYLITGYEVAGMPSNKKWSPYIVTHYRRTEENIIDGDYDYPSSCYVQSRWDWSSSSASGKWSAPAQTYRLLQYSVVTEDQPFNYGQSVITTKSRLGGSGRSLSLKFESETGKDFHLYGWSVSVSANPVI